MCSGGKELQFKLSALEKTQPFAFSYKFGPHSCAWTICYYSRSAEPFWWLTMFRPPASDGFYCFSSSTMSSSATNLHPQQHVVLLGRMCNVSAPSVMLTVRSPPVVDVSGESYRRVVRSEAVQVVENGVPGWPQLSILSDERNSHCTWGD